MRDEGDGDGENEMDSLIRCFFNGRWYIIIWSPEVEQSPPPTTPSYP